MALSLYLGIVSAIDMPARQSSILLMVENRKTLKSALALQSMTFNLSRLIGPSIAGFIVYYAGEGLCFLLTAILYLPVLFVLYRIKFNEMPHEIEDCLAGISIAETIPRYRLNAIIK